MNGTVPSWGSGSLALNVVNNLSLDLSFGCQILATNGLFLVAFWVAQISNPTGRFRYILLMEEILHQLKGSLSHHLQGFIHPRWLFGISSINSILYLSPCAEFLFFTLDFKVLSFVIVPLVGFPGWEWAIFLEVAGGQVDPSSMTNETLVEKTPDLEKYDLTVYTWGNSSTKKSFGVLFLKK